ncbi:MAG: PA2169 family four-helix-bundle protein [Saprospiraceae bacterium]|nr:PA2169 family four-helix-bundle protein [Saprospiraceae bacterium]
MDTLKVKDALKSLITRLQDAEEGYLKIAEKTTNDKLKQWLNRYSKERHTMHRDLEGQLLRLGEVVDVKTSFLGDMHRMFIDLKLTLVDNENEFEAIVNEIERGATVLIEDYTKVIVELDGSNHLRKILIGQKTIIESELKELVKLKDELLAIEA